jgi:hypothetical protein
MSPRGAGAGNQDIPSAGMAHARGQPPADCRSRSEIRLDKSTRYNDE